MKCGKNESNRALEEQVEQLRASEKSRAAELSQARQMIQKLKTKEKYLESRVESLANQITLTVQEYETRLGEAREMGHI
jgi:predicted  nucleic acid-binding Zn-ribbon protein